MLGIDSTAVCGKPLLDYQSWALSEESTSFSSTEKEALQGPSAITLEMPPFERIGMEVEDVELEYLATRVLVFCRPSPLVEVCVCLAAA